MGFKPLHDRVLVRRLGEEDKTAGGIIIPDTAQEKPSEGKIVAVGSGTRADDGSVRKLDVKVNDRVLFGKFGGTDVKVDGEDLVILRESDILGIIDNKGKSKDDEAISAGRCRHHGPHCGGPYSRAPSGDCPFVSGQSSWSGR